MNMKNRKINYQNAFRITNIVLNACQSFDTIQATILSIVIIYYFR